MAYKLGECFELLNLRLPTLVQFLHGITAVHKTDDKATSELTVLEFMEEKCWQFKLRVRNTSLNLQEPSHNWNKTTIKRFLEF